MKGDVMKGPWCKTFSMLGNSGHFVKDLAKVLWLEGGRFAVYGLRSTVYGLRSTVYGLRSTVCGLWSTVLPFTAHRSPPTFHPAQTIGQ